MKKYWGIIGAFLIAATLTGCGNNSQSKTSNTKNVSTNKVVKSTHDKSTKTPGIKTSTAFSGLDFTGDWAVDMTQIRFKGDKFIWKYKAVLNEKAVEEGRESELIFKLVSLQGTYDYDSKSKVITLNINNQSKSYLGQDEALVAYQYQSLASKPMPKQMHLKYYTEKRTGQKSLVIKDKGFYKIVPMYKGTSDSDPSYEHLVQVFGVRALDSKMHKETNTVTQDSNSQTSDSQDSDSQTSNSQSSNSQSTGINSAQDFADFLKNYGITSDDEIVANGDSGKEYKGYEMGEYENAYNNPGSVEPIRIVHAKYIVTIPSGDWEGIYIMGTDNQMYNGKSASRSEVEKAQPLNSEYRKMVNNN